KVERDDGGADAVAAEAAPALVEGQPRLLQVAVVLAGRRGRVGGAGQVRGVPQRQHHQPGALGLGLAKVRQRHLAYKARARRAHG
ncbi:hypothetical protein EG867_15835, partial [Enterococcus faecalis]